MSNNGHIIIPKGAKLEFPQVLLPNRGQMYTNCNRCGHREFAVAVTPITEEGCAKIKELICMKCKKTFGVDDEGKLEGEETHHKDARLYGKRKGGSPR